MNTHQIRLKIERVKGRKEEAIKSLDRSTSDFVEFDKQKGYAEKAYLIIKKVALETQQNIEKSLSDLVSIALRDIFPDPYKLKVIFEEKRGKTECQLFFEKNGVLFNPMSSSGGGPIDVAAFTLRICAWALKKPHGRNTIICDEPFRYVSANLRDLVGQMLKGLSQTMGMQFIIVTHDEILSRYADKTFIVNQEDSVSYIKTNELEKSKRRRRRR